MISTAQLPELIKALGLQLTHVKKMLGILQQEFDAISNRDLESFDKIVQEKQLQLQFLEELQPSLAPIQALLAEHPEDKDMAQHINQISNEALKNQFRSLWNELRSKLSECQRQNIMNNRIINSSHTNIQQAIAILRGDSGLPDLYGASGKQSQKNQGQSLAVA